MNKARVMTGKVRRLMVRHLVHRSSFIIHHSTRRGVVSVLSMMFLVLFGSLAAAMAIASRGNLQTAASHLHVMRAMGAELLIATNAAGGINPQLDLADLVEKGILLKIGSKKGTHYILKVGA